MVIVGETVLTPLPPGKGGMNSREGKTDPGDICRGMGLVFPRDRRDSKIRRRDGLVYMRIHL